MQLVWGEASNIEQHPVQKHARGKHKQLPVRPRNAFLPMLGPQLAKRHALALGKGLQRENSVPRFNVWN